MALIPTVKGLCRLWINPVSETYRLERVLDATLASAPGVMRRHVACLLAGPNGTRLWTAMHDLSGVTLYDCAVPASGWSRPPRLRRPLALAARGRSARLAARRRAPVDALAARLDAAPGTGRPHPEP
ncbi:hypothetical protein LP419_27210 [Massilia sp. H-1]|nr:hypothetical protein LP419_27210 [Massilia sp. H-1]